VGGLHDTVTDSETGFVFVDEKIKSFNDTLRRALDLYPYHSRWANLQKADMAQDFAWSSSANKYLDLYKKLIEGSSSIASGETYQNRSAIFGRQIREEAPQNGTGSSEKVNPK